MTKINKYIRFIFCVIAIVLAIGGVLYAQQKDYSLIEEDELFWSRLLSDPAVVNRNELYAAYVAYTEKIYDLAIETFNSCIRNNLTNEPVKAISDYYIGKTLFVLGKYGEALLKFNSASERNLGKYAYVKSAMQLNAAIAQHKQKNIPEFKAILSEVIKNPSDEKYKRIALSMYPSEDRLTMEQAAGEDTRMPDIVKEEKKPDSKKIKYMMLGINLGEIFILGKWGDLYDNTIYINPYFTYIFNDNAGISANIDYFSTEVKSTKTTYYSSMGLLGGTAGVNFNLKFTDSMSLTFLIGAGLARTVITNPGMNSTGNRTDYTSTSIDPYVNSSLSFNYSLNNLQFSAGLSSKTVYYYYVKGWQYENNDLGMISIFLGVAVKT